MRTWAALLVGCAFLEGCGGKCGEDPCPPMFEVHTWCGTSNQCTLDGAPVDCYEGGCKIPQGKTLRVPLAQFTSVLGPRQQLLFAFFDGDVAGQVTPAKLAASIDGAAATQLPPQFHGEIAVGWSPFPASGAVLDVKNGDPVIGGARTHLSFHDYACRQDHPPPVCPQ